MIIIIGSGLSGYTLAREIRKIDSHCDVAVVTKDDGHYYSKPQLSTALSHQKSAEQLILIRAEKFTTQTKIKLFPRTSVLHLDDLSQIIPGYLDDPHNHKIVLALGATPQRLPALENSRLNIHAINNLNDYTEFRKQLQSNTPIHIVGAGLVGCEFANDLILNGYSVTITAPEAYPLAKLVPQEVGIELKKTMEQKGVKWQLNQFFEPKNISPETLIISATGLHPEITLAQNSGIKAHKGIVVDDYLQTSRPNIFALGDCAEFNGQVLPYIAPLAIGARALAKTLLGEPTKVLYPPMPIYVKTSVYPIVVLSPTDHLNWKIEKTPQDNDSSLHGVRGLSYNSEDRLKGFVLGGSLTSETNDWLAQIREN